MQTAVIVLSAVVLVLLAVIVFLVAMLRFAYEDMKENYAPVDVPDVDWDYTKESGWVRG